jgi:aspartate carbamoyltransferase
MAAAESSPIAGDFRNKDIVSITQFARPDVEIVLREADAMAEVVQDQGRSDLLQDAIIANLFYEPSTRTFLSFEAAAMRLGASTISTQGVAFSSISKGETLVDTIRTVDRYADVIDMRHGDIGAAATAATVSRVPIINGGDGAGEHPTQALLDLYTIEHKLGRLENLTVTMVGDLKHGRTVHSLARLLALYPTRLNYVAPDQLAMPAGIKHELEHQGIEQSETVDLHDVIEDTDVIYMTRIQKERFDSEEEYEALKDNYIVTADTMRNAHVDAILMHPLPRVNEIHPEVDGDPRAVYFDQVESGLYIRMALLALVLGRTVTMKGPWPPLRSTIEPWMKTSGKIS